MKMGKIEKVFVNSSSHSQQVSNHYERLLAYVEPGPNQRYLDVGCGNGAAPIHVARKYGLEVTGIDIDPEQIRLAEAGRGNLSNVRFRTMDGTTLPFDDQAFDIVATNKVTHHIPNWPDALAEMVRVLKPGGYLIYADLIVPAWLAAVGKPLVGSFVGLPTGAALDRFINEHHLSPIHLSRSVWQYEAVLRKEDRSKL